MTSILEAYFEDSFFFPQDISRHSQCQLSVSCFNIYIFNHTSKQIGRNEESLEFTRVLRQMDPLCYCFNQKTKTIDIAEKVSEGKTNIFAT